MCLSVSSRCLCHPADSARLFRERLCVVCCVIELGIPGSSESKKMRIPVISEDTCHPLTHVGLMFSPFMVTAGVYAVAMLSLENAEGDKLNVFFISFSIFDIPLLSFLIFRSIDFLMTGVRTRNGFEGRSSFAVITILSWPIRGCTYAGKQRDLSREERRGSG